MAFSDSTAVLLVLLGFAVGAFGTLVGAGGGFILAPVLLILYPHDSAQTLSSISIAVVFFNALSGSAGYARQRRIDLHVGGIFGAATLPGSIAGALLVSHVPRRALRSRNGRRPHTPRPLAAHPENTPTSRSPPWPSPPNLAEHLGRR